MDLVVEAVAVLLSFVIVPIDTGGLAGAQTLKVIASPVDRVVEMQRSALSNAHPLVVHEYTLNFCSGS